MNPQDPEYLSRLLKQLNPDVLRAAEATMLKADIANLELERDAAVASTVESYNGEIAPLRARLAELERIHAGEQVSLFKVAPSVDVSNGPATNAVKTAPIVVGVENPFNAAMNYAAKYPASQEGIGAVVPCASGGTNPGVVILYDSRDDIVDCRAPRIAMTIQRNGKTYYRFKSAGYKAIAARLGIVPYVECEGDKAFYLTAEEYARVFREHKKMESERWHS